MPKAHRNYARLPVSLPVEYDDFERFHPDRLLNLSAGGAFILTPKPFPLGKQLTFRFHLPEISSSPIRAEGTVVWTPKTSNSSVGNRHPVGMGIEFIELDEDVYHLIDQYVTVTSGLKNLDTRIGRELPAHILSSLPNPSRDAVHVRLED